MDLITERIGDRIVNMLETAIEVKIAVAYFSPDNRTLKALKAISKVELIVSDEFESIDPYKLEELEKDGAAVSYVLSDSNLGKLHSKVYYGKRKDGSEFIFVTSANLTYAGFYSNCESSIYVDSRNDDEKGVFIDFIKWIDCLKAKSKQIDYEIIRSIYNKRSARKSSSAHGSPKARCWVLKTTSGGDINSDYWNRFISDGVVAIGWGEDLENDPKHTDCETMVGEIRERYSDEKTNPSARIYGKIMKFVNMAVGDFVIILRGYNPTADAPVHLYGIGKITGEFYIHRESGWWVYKHSADLQRIDQKFPKDLFVKTLEKRSLMEAIHEIDERAFNNLIRLLKKEYSVSIDL